MGLHTLLFMKLLFIKELKYLESLIIDILRQLS